MIIKEAKKVFDELGFAGCNRKECIRSTNTNDCDQFNKSQLDIFKLESRSTNSNVGTNTKDNGFGFAKQLLGCDFFVRIRRYADMQITPSKVFVFASVLLRIRHADARIFHFRCTNTHTN